MTTQVQEFLHAFEELSDADQHEAAFEILHKTIHFHFPPLGDDELIYAADDLFLALEEEEAVYG